MKWSDLSREAKCLLEQAFKIHNDKPNTVLWKIGGWYRLHDWNPVLNISFLVTEELANECIKYSKHNDSKDDSLGSVRCQLITNASKEQTDKYLLIQGIDPQGNLEQI